MVGACDPAKPHPNSLHDPSVPVDAGVDRLVITVGASAGGANGCGASHPDDGSGGVAASGAGGTSGLPLADAGTGDARAADADVADARTADASGAGGKTSAGGVPGGASTGGTVGVGASGGSVGSTGGRGGSGSGGAGSGDPIVGIGGRGAAGAPGGATGGADGSAGRAGGAGSSSGSAGGAAQSGDAGAGGADGLGGAPALPSAPAPGAGELAIVELLINPAGTDTGREWIEVVNRAAHAVDLSSLHVADAANDAAVDFAALAGVGARPELAPGARAVLIQSIDPTKNGGIAVGASLMGGAFGTRVSLNNDTDTISVCAGACADGIVIHQVTWDQGLGTGYDGHALSIDDSGKHCPGVAAFGDGGSFGTPGAPNPACP
jgi:hypothetical protein